MAPRGSRPSIAVLAILLLALFPVTLRAETADAVALTNAAALEKRFTAALAAGDDFRARYIADKLFHAAPGSAQAFRSCLFIAERSYAARSFLTALEFYKDAVASFDAGFAAGTRELNLALLRAAEISLYHAQDARGADAFFRRIDARHVDASELPLIRAMRVRLSWSTLQPESLGLADGNVSSLRIDGDDLWVGTWSGGVSRYSISARHADAFPSPAYPRTVESDERRVWVGGTDGLSWFGKSSGTWNTEKSFPGQDSPGGTTVQTVKLVGQGLYVGTLGNGLFRRDEEGWKQVSDGGLPGPFVTTIEPGADGKELYIGTMTLGLIVMDAETGSMKALSAIAPSFSAQNVTTILDDGQGSVWIGTYGDGLWRWSPGLGTLRHFSKASGEIGDDWILSSCRTRRALYFGSFGAGASAYVPTSGAWRRYGITEGLGSLDVAAIAWREPFVFFGTLGAGVSVYNEESDGPQL